LRPILVIAGLDPAIHQNHGIVCSLMDARVKPGHGEQELADRPE
jgi:hypothetical protein